MAILAGCEVSLRHRPESCYLFKVEWYERLKDMLDQKETGWVEAESVHEGGKMLFRMEDVADLFLVTPEYCANKESWDAVNKED